MPEAAAPDGASTTLSQDKKARRATVRLLQVLAAAALLLPLLLLLFVGWSRYRETQELVNERLVRSLDVMQEQALKAFQSMTLALDTIDFLLANHSPAEIQSDEARLHDQLIRIQAALPEVQSIWIFGPTGHPQVMTRESPALTSLDYSDQDYFIEPRDGGSGVYIGGIHQSISGGQPYFTFNRARHDADGKFSGVVEMSLLPSDFSRFYAQLESGGGGRFAMVRDNGTVLARFPALADDLRLDEGSGFRKAVAANPSGRFYTSTSNVDMIERRVAIRRLPGLPIYVTASTETAQIRSEWLGGMTLLLVFGVLAAGFLFGALVVALRRTAALYAEQDRREAAEMAVRQAQRMDAIGQITGGVAHDFNNLLTIIIGNLEGVQRQLDAWKEGAQITLARRVANAMHGAQRAATLTKRLLAFSRQQPLNPAVLDVDRQLNGLYDFLKRALGEDISLEIVGTGGIWPVEADAAELEAAILNLGLNARDAMPGGGKLTIESSNSYLDEAYCRTYPDIKPGQYVQVAVTDTGAGMTRQNADRAFEPFFTTKQVGQGTGLGLSQVYGFVKQSGGHVRIYSEVGEGTTVKIYLPRFAGTYVPQEVVERESRRGQSGECILVVEDDTDVRGYVVETLEGLGYDVLQAAEADEALRLLERYKTIGLLLTDVVMPGMNGRLLAEEAKQRRPALRVVFMTGYSRNAIVHQGRLDAGVELIQKPLTSEILAATVRKVLDA